MDDDYLQFHRMLNAQKFIALALDEKSRNDMKISVCECECVEVVAVKYDRAYWIERKISTNQMAMAPYSARLWNAILSLFRFIHSREFEIIAFCSVDRNAMAAHWFPVRSLHFSFISFSECSFRFWCSGASLSAECCDALQQRSRSWD